MYGAFSLACVSAFTCNAPPSTVDVPKFAPSVDTNRYPHRLFGISEWRDAVFEGNSDSGRVISYISGSTNSVGIVDSSQVIKREICVLPFPYEDIILQGETKQLRLYEDRFLKLFEKCQNEHHGVLCMGLLTDSSGIVQTAALCEIEDFNRSKEFGIFASIRVVGRVKLLALTKMEPFITAICSEMVDEIPPSLDLPNMVADGIDSLLNELSILELRLRQAQEYRDSQENSADDSISPKGSDDAKERQKFVQAALDSSSNSFDDLLDDDENENDEIAPYFKMRFEEAYNEAYKYDTQGFVVSNTSSSSFERSARELAAISWASFCVGEITLTEKIQALDCDNLFDRLKFAAHALREKKNMLAAKLAISGLDASSSESGDEKENS